MSKTDGHKFKYKSGDTVMLSDSTMWTVKEPVWGGMNRYGYSFVENEKKYADECEIIRRIRK